MNLYSLLIQERNDFMEMDHSDCEDGLFASNIPLPKLVIDNLGDLLKHHCCLFLMEVPQF